MRARRAVLAGALVFLGVVSSLASAQRQHLVAPGDTLFALAGRYGTTVEALRNANALSGDLLRVGQLIELPAGPGFRTERSQAGENLTDVARRFGLLVVTLRLANPELDGSAQLAPETAVRVPPTDGLPLRLQAGASLLELAIGHGVSPAELLRVNGLASLAEPVEGGWLLLPVPQAVGGADRATVESAPALPTPGLPAESDDTRAGDAGVGAPGGAAAGTAGGTAGGTAEATAATDTTAARAAPMDGAAGPIDPVEGADWHALLQAELLRGAPALLGEFRPMSQDFILPLTGRLSSSFGWRDISVAGNRFHGGIDLAVDTGTPVAAALDGVVGRTGWVGAYGYSVYLDHDDSLQTRYAHLSSVLVVPGEIVRQGDVIALAGSTGASTGPHLHFEIRIGGVAVDPLSLLP